ncbi:hypothetical protein C1X05_05695 [Laceyella sacchari]|jgi:hypothetical protein|uniref:Uncharacterized protein n=2 Tax=Laceyella TaxID=292635 RepID=A0AA45WKB5_9BACL|nr:MULTISPECIES: hypothetical protein [Laceyella]AUS08372.1 hypothetical protein C1X05_05695 [Laceyella sacchari]MRG28722.1 hypothetical protein [Laceyella tengchongensis]PRZ15905.1 hypothetical protein CLV36_103131 [Laceyella sediminis]SMP06237.1 hypothetical protein SAMN06265361_101685 [Laceyella tengchongensis]
MREWSLEWIEIGEPVRYGPFTIDRYVADVELLGWIIYEPGKPPFLTRDVQAATEYLMSRQLGEIVDKGEY